MQLVDTYLDIPYVEVRVNDDKPDVDILLIANLLSQTKCGYACSDQSVSLVVSAEHMFTTISDSVVPRGGRLDMRLPLPLVCLIGQTGRYMLTTQL